MKKITIHISSCRPCPYFKKYGVSSSPGCSHHTFQLEPFGVKALPSKEEYDVYSNSDIKVYTGDLPDWCPLPNV